MDDMTRTPLNIVQLAWVVQALSWDHEPEVIQVSSGVAMEGTGVPAAGDIHVVLTPDGRLWPGHPWNNQTTAAGQGRAFRLGVVGGTGPQATVTPLQLQNLGEAITCLQKKFPVLARRGRVTLLPAAAGASSPLTEAVLLSHVARARTPAVSKRREQALRAFSPSSVQGRAAAALLSQLLLNPTMNTPMITNDTTIAAMQPARDLDLEQLTPEQVATLKKHVINLSHGKLNGGGPFSTSEKDVNTLFDTHLAKALADAKKDKRKLRILIWAHGGLVNEPGALDHVLRHHKQWLSVDVYPVYFVWETGFMTALRSKLGWDKEERGWKDWISAPTDWALEKVAYYPGNAIWGQIKQYAADAVKADGGALYAAKKLAGFINTSTNADHIELLACGHSAGSNFHSFFIPTALRAGVPGFKELFLLAPAITSEDFESRLAGLIGKDKGIGRSTMFTMNEKTELADNCFKIYRKSLLYFISRSFEPGVPTPILGLEESLRASKSLRELYGLNGSPSKLGQVVFSPTKESTGASATQSTTHGGFDNDSPTLNSMASRIVGKTVAPFKPEDERALADFAPSLEEVVVDAGWRGGDRKSLRRALCIGIDDYPTKPLSGCVNDARLWKAELEKLGFDTGLLLNGQASREGILNAVKELARGCKEGDVLVVQCSSHGTQVPDVNGDEKDRIDEALVPFDYESGNLLIDDDIGRLLDRLPKGVNLTLFLDYCHSGTSSRLFRAPGLSSIDDERERFMVLPRAALDAYVDKRKDEPRGAPNPYKGTVEVLFAACSPAQTAKEKDGHGYFTRTAVPLLGLSKGGISHADFLKRVLQGFPLPSDSQLPQLDCDDKKQGSQLFGALTVRETENMTEVAPEAGGQKVDPAVLMETMRDYMKLLNKLL